MRKLYGIRTGEKAANCVSHSVAATSTLHFAEMKRCLARPISRQWPREILCPLPRSEDNKRKDKANDSRTQTQPQGA